MHYSYEFTVPITATVAAPYIQLIKLGAGRIRRVDIDFPSGCGRAVRVQLWNGGAQILPTNPEGFYAEDGRTIDAGLYYDLNNKDNNLYFVAWVVSASYPHTLSVQIEVQGNDEPDIVSLTTIMYQTLNRLIDLIREFI